MHGINDVVSRRISAVVEMIPVTIEGFVLQASAQLCEKRRESVLARLLAPKVVPPPNAKLLQAFQRAIPNIRISHGPVPQVDLIRPRLPRDIPAKKGLPEAALVLSCLLLAGCLLGGMSTGGLVCLAGAIAGFTCFCGWARRNAALLLNVHNAKAWTSATALPLPMAASSTAMGVVCELERTDAAYLACLTRDYVLNELLCSPFSGSLLSAVEPFLRRFAAGLVRSEATTVPVVMGISVPEQSMPFDLRLPNLRFTLLFDLSLAGPGPYFSRMRAVVLDAVISQVLKALCAQIQEKDLRGADAQLSGFTEPVHVAFDLDLQWPHHDRARFEARNVQCELKLPH